MLWSLSQLHCKLRYKALHSCSDLPPTVRSVLQNAVWFLPRSSCSLLEDLADGGWPWSSCPCRWSEARSIQALIVQHLHVLLLVPTCIPACTHMYHCLYQHVLLLVSPCSPCQWCIPILEPKSRCVPSCPALRKAAGWTVCFLKHFLKTEHHDHPHIWTPSVSDADEYIAANCMIALPSKH